MTTIQIYSFTHLLKSNLSSIEDIGILGYSVEKGTRDKSSIDNRKNSR